MENKIHKFLYICYIFYERPDYFYIHYLISNKSLHYDKKQKRNQSFLLFELLSLKTHSTAPGFSYRKVIRGG